MNAAHPSVMSKFEQIDCCEPERTPTGGGWRWYHSRTCAVSPNAKMRETHPELFRPAPSKLLHSLQPHAACEAAFADGGSPCSRCGPILEPTPYDEAHRDDAPDWGEA